jgi:hypothetical protein
MGTRNLTIVKSRDKVKVAQYGQWDGYPTGQGQTIASFLKKLDDTDLKVFKVRVDSLKPYTDKEVKAIYDSFGATGQFIRIDLADKIDKEHPELSRNTGAEILELIYNGTVKRVRLDEEFEKDTLFCEYCYKIDIDKKTVTMNGETYTFDEWISDKFMQKLEAVGDDQ